MNINISRPIFTLVFMVMLHTVPVPRSEAFLGDLWDTVKSWFTGGKKVDAELEAQLKLTLENTNRSQNEVIAAINEVTILQRELQNINNPDDKARLDKNMQAMQQAVQQNNDTYLRLMEIRSKLQEAGVADKYEAQFSPYVSKQQEIESYYRPIEDRYNELAAFSGGAEDNTLPLSGIDTDVPVDLMARSMPAVSAEPAWQKSEVRSGIDAWLRANNLDEWGRPVTAGVSSSGAPVGGVGKDRYQYLFDTFPKLRSHLEANGVSLDMAAQSAPSVVSAEVNLGEYTPAGASIVDSLTEAPAAASSSQSVATVRGGYALQNRYDNAALRQERDNVYRQMNELIAAGQMSSTEYKQLYTKYTQLSDQINK